MEQRFCGRALELTVSGLDEAQLPRLLVFAEFRNKRTPSLFQIGARCTKQRLSDLSDRIMFAEFVRSLDVHQLRYVVHPPRKWHYPGKLRSTDWHMLQVYLVLDERITATDNSSAFHVIPIWKNEEGGKAADAKQAKEGIEEDDEERPARAEEEEPGNAQEDAGSDDPTMPLRSPQSTVSVSPTPAVQNALARPSSSPSIPGTSSAYQLPRPSSTANLITPVPRLPPAVVPVTTMINRHLQAPMGAGGPKSSVRPISTDWMNSRAVQQPFAAPQHVSYQVTRSMLDSMPQPLYGYDHAANLQTQLAQQVAFPQTQQVPFRPAPTTNPYQQPVDQPHLYLPQHPQFFSVPQSHAQNPHQQPQAGGFYLGALQQFPVLLNPPSQARTSMQLTAPGFSLSIAGGGNPEPPQPLYFNATLQQIRGAPQFATPLLSPPRAPPRF
jgi:hypothetical protein